MIKIINRDELVRMMCEKENFRLVDVLDNKHFREEHIKGAISLPLNDIETRANKVLDKNEKIVVYCASFECQASTLAAKKLIAMGYKNVLDYKGGLKDYKEGDLPLRGSLYKEAFKTLVCNC